MIMVNVVNIIIKGEKMIKAIGIVRKVDELGRIVLPIELRKSMDIGELQPVEIYVDGETINVKKYVPSCIFCGGVDNMKVIREKDVCNDCISEMKEIIS